MHQEAFIVKFYFHWIVCFIKKPIETWEEDIDWWSKYYASIGELDKCKNYVELGYDKIQVLAITIYTWKLLFFFEFNFQSFFKYKLGQTVNLFNNCSLSMQ